MGLLDSLKNLFGGGNAAPVADTPATPEAPVMPEAPVAPMAPMADMASDMDAPVETPVA